MKSQKVLGSFGSLLAGGLALAVCMPLAAAGETTSDGYFGWLSVGAVYPMDDDHIYWVGQFSGAMGDRGEATVFNNSSLQCPGSLFINTKDGTAKGSGYCQYVTTGGDTAYASWECEGGAPMSGKSCDGTVTFMSGTGKLAGITGGNRFEASTVAFHSDGTGSGYSMIQNGFSLPK